MNALYAGSETEENLKAAFSMESEARNRYTYYASVAKKEGFEQIAAVLLHLADNEKEHAKIWFKEFDTIDCTEDNLRRAMLNEKHEWEDVYSHYAEVADREGFPELAKKFRQVGSVELHHEEILKKLFQNVQKSQFFRKSEIKIWECRNCGHVHIGLSAPEICPTCNHPQAYFEVMAENY